MREGKEKGVEENGGFMRPEEKNLTDISEENRNKSCSRNTQKIKKKPNSPDNMGVARRTEAMVNYQDRQNIAKKNHRINNVTPQTDNTKMIYNEITK